MTTDTTTGEATIYFAMPSAPDEANAASLNTHAETLTECAKMCATLESMGWKPRWCDNPGDNEFFEFAYEKRFDSEDDAAAEVADLKFGFVPMWDDD